METKKPEFKMFIFLILIGILCFHFVSSAGFASSYMPSINNKDVFIVDMAQKSFMIYLQNQGTQNEITKIEVLDTNKIIQNNLSERYTVPGKSFSDSFPVELKIKIPVDAVKGQVYEIKYFISYASNVDSAIVSFGKTSYEKTFYVSYGDPNWSTLGTNKEAMLSRTTIQLTQNKVTKWFKDLFSNDGLEIGTDAEKLNMSIKKNALRGAVIGVPIIIIGGALYGIRKRKKRLQRQREQQFYY